MEQFGVGWNIAHRRAVMRKSDVPLFIDDTVQRHAAQFEQVHLLSVHARHPVIRVGQTNERNLFVLPIAFEGLGIVRSHREDLGVAPHKALMILLQARQLRAAVRSHKAAQEGKHNRLAAAEIRKADEPPLHVGQFKVRGGFPGSDQFGCHYSVNFSRKFAVASATSIHCSSAVIEAGLSPS